MWELLHSASNGKEYKALREDLAALEQAPFEDADWERAGLTVLDKDFDLVAEVTGQPCEWIAPKGSL